VHAPLVERHARALRIRRYVQMHTGFDALNDAARASRDAPQGYDGVAELWWDSAEDLARGIASEAGRGAAAALLEDERRFIDLARSPLFYGEEHPIVAD
jgi:hypothetical protein